MDLKIIILFSFVSLIVLAVVSELPSESWTEAQFVQHSQNFAQQHNYLAALETVDLGLVKYPNSAALAGEFRKNSELYIVREISKGYQRIDENPYDVDAYIRVSNAFRLAGQNLKALEVLTEGTFENPRAGSLWMAIGNLEELSGRPKEARSAFREAKRYEFTH
jgi:tetratricopeptide (TPR) repeat protein